MARLFQKRVKDLILSGKNVILHAPTGSGKTRAALLPFVDNLTSPVEDDTRLPRTCRYAVPLRALSDHLNNQYGELLQEEIEDPDSEFDMQAFNNDYAAYGIEPVSRQTGAQRGDPYFEAAVTFCTIDQLMAAYLGIPYSVPLKDANIKVAGVAGSYLVLDEWHLFPLLYTDPEMSRWEAKGARATSLVMLKMLQEAGLARFIVMTATLSTKLVQRLATFLGAEVENLDPGPRDGKTAAEVHTEELREVVGDRGRTWRKVPRTLVESVDTILEQHLLDSQESGGATTLIVCNTVERAQQVYLRLWTRLREQDQEWPHMLLHARFTAEDRQEKERRIDQHFGKQAWKTGLPNAIIVTTQVVEVGMNFSVRRLHTELAPANSLIQRAGRCARFEGQYGEVLVYRVPEGRRWSLPYAPKPCLDTWGKLCETPTPMGFDEEQALINAVHTDEDIAFLTRCEREYSTIKERIIKGWNSREGLGSARELIREVAQVQVIIHDDPDSITSDPWRYQSFSLHPTTLRSRFSRLEELAQELGADYVLKRAILDEQSGPGAEDDDSRAAVSCHWDCLTKAEVESYVLDAAPMLALPTALAHYSSELGFTFRDYDRLPELRNFEAGKDRWQSTKINGSGRSRGAYTIQTCSYQYHIAGLVKAYQTLLAAEMRWSSRILEDALGYHHGTIDKAMRLLIAYHDAGKLTVDWQKWAQAWQRYVVELEVRDDMDGQSGCKDALLAKTDYDSVKHGELQRNYKPPRPPHAVEGMALMSAVIYEAAQCIAPADSRNQHALTRAMRAAIARHHTTYAEQHRSAQLHADAARIITGAVAQACANEPWSHLVQAFPPFSGVKEGGVTQSILAIEPEADLAPIFLYFLLARTLRLADRRADMSYLGNRPRLP